MTDPFGNSLGYDPGRDEPTDYSDLADLATERRNGPPPNGKRPHADISEPVDLLAGLRTGAWLDRQDFPPLRYHLPGVVPEGSTLLVGPPKIGKSWFVLSLALATASGGRALGLAVDTRPTLYMALEDGDRRMQDRCRTLLAGDPIPPAFEYLTAVQPLTLLATIEAWLDRHPGSEPLVVLDTLGKVMPPAVMGESSYSRDYRVGGALKRLADDRPGAGLLVNHHDRKAGSDDFVDRVSGTNGLAGAADTIVVLTRARHEQTGTINVTGRDVAEGEYAVTFTGALWQLDGGGLAAAASKAARDRAATGVSDRSVEVLDFVAEHPGGVRSAEVELALGPDARRYLARLTDSGRLVRLKRGLYATTETVSQVSPVPNEPPSLGHGDGWDAPLGET
jgi:hypothetical protein